jgi:hypothetical protein|nr:MAG TPA: hypothetical protein [Caudoviricetes sp.]
MKYIQLIEQARTHGVASEKKMYAAIEQMSCDLSTLENENPCLYWRIMRNQHAVLYDRHYSEKFANHDVNRLIYSKMDENGEPVGMGAHWTRTQVLEATKDMKFHPKVNDWDKYVAFNAMYADLCANMDDKEILKAAYLFYFCDADWQTEDDCTKIWDYTALHATL